LILAEQEPQAETTKARDKEVQENLLKRESRPAKIHEERVGETGNLSRLVRFPFAGPATVITERNG
jgi:hypothetical protein